MKRPQIHFIKFFRALVASLFVCALLPSLSFAGSGGNGDSVTIDQPISGFVFNNATSQAVVFGGTCIVGGVGTSSNFVHLIVANVVDTNIECINEAWQSAPLDVSGANVANFQIQASATFLSANDQKNWIFDVAGPNITLFQNPIQVVLNSTFGRTEALANVSSVIDDRDGNIPVQNLNTTGVPVDTTTPGDKTVRYTISDAAGNQSYKVLTVQVVDQNYLLTLLTPQDGERGTTLNPHFSWGMQPNDSSFNYIIKISTSSGCPDFIYRSFRIQALQFDLPDGISLNYSKQYYWCVTAYDSGNNELTSAEAEFRTESQTVPVLSLDISNPQTQPSGQQTITIHGVNGEDGSMAHFYEVTANGKTEVGSSLIDYNGEVSLDVSLSEVDQAKTFYYTARVDRGNQYGEYSDQVSYQYDPSLSLDAPVLLHMDPHQDGTMRWLPVDGATSYHVYRRVARELCDASVDTCYLGTKPFKEVGGNYSNQNGYIVFEDSDDFNELRNEAGGEGISYFVTAQNDAGERSLRSNSISFYDSTLVDFIYDNDGHSISPYFDFVTDPYGTKVYADGVQNYALDNSADLVSYIEYEKRGDHQNCSFDFDNNANQMISIFDSLDRRNVDGTTIENASLISDITQLDPNDSYCFQVCVDDISNNGKVCDQKKQIDTPPDTTPPEFDGIESLDAGSDGTSLTATWLEAIPQSQQEIIHYEVNVTPATKVDSNGNPIFDDSAIIVPSDQTSLTISNLKTGTGYFVRVAALDASGNPSYGGKPNGLSASTLDNNPHILSASLSLKNSLQDATLCLKTYDRNKINGERLAITNFSIGPANAVQLSSVENLQSRVMASTVHLDSLSASQTSQDCFDMDVNDMLTVDSYGATAYSVEVQDSAGNSATYNGSTALLSGLAQGTGNFGPSLCSLKAEQQPKRAGNLFIIILFSLVSLAFIGKKQSIL